jgi:outer membrane protein TolC
MTDNRERLGRRRRAAWLTALGCVLGGVGVVAAQAPAPPPVPARVGYADPAGLVPPATPYPEGKQSDSYPPAATVPAQPATNLPQPKPLSAPAADQVKPLPINLPYALRLVNASNPTIAIAQARVEEAYARLGQAKAAWLPNLWAGGNPDNLTFMPMYSVHNGILQNSRGQVFEVVKAEAAFPVGAGLNLSLADAFFAPRIARDLVAAEQARARVVTYNVHLDVALTYLDLIRVYGALAITGETMAQAELMLDFATQADKQGLGKTTADPNRARTEVELRRQERIDLEAEAAVVSSRLTQLLLLDPTVDLIPADAQILPIELVPTQGSLDELIGIGLMNRPELAESRALVAAALSRWREEKTRPLIPNLQMAYYGAQFGGGTPALHDYGWRDDFMIQASWELRNAGLGNWFESKATRAQYNVANLHVTEVQAQVAAEVATAAKLVRARERELSNAQEAVRQAETMWEKLRRAAFGLVGGFGGRARQYDPLEPLLAEQALHEARLRYLSAVIDYNRNQFRLFWAMGQPPLCALPKATALPVQTPVLPSPSRMAKPSAEVSPMPQLPPADKP